MKRSLYILALLTFILLHSPTVAQQQDPVIERIESYLTELERVGFSGSVLVEWNGEKAISAGYGLKDQETQQTNSPTTVFDIASITKQFTASAILKLEMDGKLSVQDPISKYFTQLPEDKASITIHDLLRHQSGLASNVGKDFEPITEAEFLVKVFNRPLNFPTGTAFGYSNIGYSLLGLIIERVSGVSYETYLYQQLWKPAGMETTGYTRPIFEPDSVAVVYHRDGRIWGKPNEKDWDETAPYLHLAGNGGILSTTEDLYKWHLALLGDEILSAAAKQKLYQPTIRDNEDPNAIYAYGWDVSNTPRNTRLVWHNGANGFLYADFHRFIDEGIAIIMLSNKSHPDFDILNREIIKIIFDPEYSPAIP